MLLHIQYPTSKWKKHPWNCSAFPLTIYDQETLPIADALFYQQLLFVKIVYHCHKLFNQLRVFFKTIPNNNGVGTGFQ